MLAMKKLRVARSKQSEIIDESSRNDELGQLITDVVSRPAPLVLTIWYNGPHQSCAASHEVVVRHNARTDLHIADLRISSTHLILCF